MARKGENIYKRKDGRWEGRYPIGRNARGKTKYRSVYGKTYAEVREKLLPLKAKGYTYQESGRLTVGMLFEEWLSAVQLRVKPSTYANYRMKADKHILPEFGGIRYDKLTVQMLHAFIERKLQGGLSAKYVSDIVVVIKSMAKYASRVHGFRNLLQDVMLPKIPGTERKILSPKEQKTLCRHLQKHENSTSLCILLSLYTGLRVGEVCGLRWGDIDFTKRRSAVIALVFQLAPEIYKAFDYLIRNGEIDTEQLKIAGFKAISAGATGFLNGSVSAALTIACKSGKLGTSLMTISPQVIGAMTVIVLDTMKNSLLVAIKKKTPQEMGTELAKELLISSASLGGGVIGQALVPELPVLGYMLGSFLGSTIASVGIQVGEKTLISFCIQSGFTCFGLVEQDYQLPKSVLEQMGIKTLDIQRVNIRHAKINRCAIAHAQVNHLQISTIQITVVQRGLIAVNKIGYMI